MWSFIHLIKIIKAFFGGQLRSKQFRGCQEAQFTISACDIVGKWDIGHETGTNRGLIHAFIHLFTHIYLHLTHSKKGLEVVEL